MSFCLNSFSPRGRDFPKPLTDLAPILLQQGLQVGEQSRTLLRVAEAELYAGGNKAGGIAEIMANAIMDHNVDGVTLGDEESDGVGKLQLPALAGSDTAESAKNRAVQKVAPRSQQIRRRILNRGLFHHAHNLLHPIIVGSRNIKEAIIRHLRRLHLYCKQHRTAMLLTHPNHLTHDDVGRNSAIRKYYRGIVLINI